MPPCIPSRARKKGEALVLAAIFGLVLMLCVLGTVNLGRAVYDKVQLQAAADSAAYSQAAVEARVFNFTAYTNRAMVVHYASLMAATSYLTYLHFEWPFLGRRSSWGSSRPASGRRAPPSSR